MNGVIYSSKVLALAETFIIVVIAIIYGTKSLYKHNGKSMLFLLSPFYVMIV